MVAGQARWCGIVQAGYARTVRETGQSPAEVAAREDAVYKLVITAEDFPQLRQAVDAGVFLDEDDPFRIGLARTLDGIAARIEAAGG